jgi:glycosyltransferase involved in cell wall biosynthesis
MRPSPKALGGGPPAPVGAPTPRPLTILHVVESLGSGVATALESYLQSTPGHVHVVLGWRRKGAQTGDEVDRLAADALSLPSGRLAQLRAVRRWVKRVRPDVVHAHSSYAGLYVRLLPRRLAAAVVYTPHGFSFERRDVPAPVRGAFWLAEAALALRGGCVAAVGPREAELARRLPGRQPVIYVPNVVRPLQPVPPLARRQAGVPHLRLATLGRITPQKDPEFFRRLVLLGRRLELPLEWTWIGGGEPAAERALQDAGVLVTGWSPRSAALGRLAMADVYVHTAAWEGTPVSILEAAALGLPIVARRNPALAGLGLPSLFDTPEALIDTIRSLFDERRRTELRAASERLLCQHRPEAQREALEHAYAVALGSDADRRRLRLVR